MGLFNIDKPLDQWAQFDDAVVVTFVMQLSCLIISVTLFLVRFIQVIRHYKDHTRMVRMLDWTHLAAMLLSILYMYLHYWNYRHYFIAQNPMPCDIWYVLIVCTLTASKNFVYAFLMLRSSVAFRMRFFQIPLKLSIAVIVISTAAQWTVSALLLADFTPVSPFPGKGFCFRLLGETGNAGLLAYNLADALCACMALAVFWWKACFVSNGMAQLQVIKSKESADMLAVNAVFRKNIVLGILILVGPIVLFWMSEALTVLMGIAYAAQQTAGNVYIFLIFKENAAIYNVLCGCCRTRAEREEAKLGPPTAVLSMKAVAQQSNTLTLEDLNNGSSIVMATPGATVLAVLS